jgi:hypothetical protein
VRESALRRSGNRSGEEVLWERGRARAGDAETKVRGRKWQASARLAVEVRARSAHVARRASTSRAPAGARRRPRDLARLASARCEVDRRMYAAHNQQMPLVLLFLPCALRTCYGVDDLAYPSG